MDKRTAMIQMQMASARRNINFFILADDLEWIWIFLVVLLLSIGRTRDLEKVLVFMSTLLSNNLSHHHSGASEEHQLDDHDGYAQSHGEQYVPTAALRNRGMRNSVQPWSQRTPHPGDHD
jgi:hypothetical protein